MTHRRSYNDTGHAHFLTFSCYRNQQLLTDDRVRAILAATIDAARQIEHFHLWAYVFMPDHVHLLVHPTIDNYSIARLLRRIKEPTAHRIVALWKQQAPRTLVHLRTHQGRRPIHRFWQAGGGFDRNLTDWDAIAQAVDYIEFNPVRRGLVNDPTEWCWSSARARAGFEGVVLGIDSMEIGVPVHGESADKP